MLITILIPVYNEETTLSTVVKFIFKYLKEYNIEIIIINDASTDLTGKIGRKIVKKYKNVKYIEHNRNLGKSGAINSGFGESNGNIILIQDADLEYHPKDIPRVIDPIINNHADVCFGSRFKGKIHGMKASHVFGNRFLSLVTKFLYNLPVTDMETGYKAFKRQIFSKIKFPGQGFELEPEINIQISRLKIRFKEVPIDFYVRQHGSKNISWRDGLIAFKVLLYNYLIKKK